MSLLLQTIQEYLEDNHPNWDAVDHRPYAIYINRALRPNDYINITTHNHTMTTTQLGTEKGQITEHYTEHTILPQITKLINHIEQP